MHCLRLSVISACVQAIEPVRERKTERVCVRVSVCMCVCVCMSVNEVSGCQMHLREFDLVDRV